MSIETQKRYAVYPGSGWSRNDDQRHYIAFRELCGLYGVDQGECVDMGPGGNRRGFREPPGMIRLYPRNDGDYTVPES